MAVKRVAGGRDQDPSSSDEEKRGSLRGSEQSWSSYLPRASTTTSSAIADSTAFISTWLLGNGDAGAIAALSAWRLDEGSVETGGAVTMMSSDLKTLRKMHVGGEGSMVLSTP